MLTKTQVQERYQAALDSLVSRLQEDYYVLAAVLYGSLARGEAWERSDIDLMIVLKDGQEREVRQWWLVENDINLNAYAVTRNRLKRELEGSLQGSIWHSVRSQFKVLFSKDELIETWLKESKAVGAHDQSYQLLQSVSPIPYYLDKAEKWLFVKQDNNYCLMWILFAVNTLARVEVVLNGEAPGREALDQAMKFNPKFFGSVYSDLINGPKTAERLGAVLEQIDRYLLDRSGQIFKAVLDYLAEVQGPCGISDLDTHFKKKAPDAMLGNVYDWLARKGIIHRLSSPVRLTRKSQITLDEPAFYYDVDDTADWE